MSHEVKIPKWGLTTETMTIVSWLKQVGDEVAEGEPICAVDTDKAESEIECPVSGTLVEHRAQVDDECTVGQVIAVVETD